MTLIHQLQALIVLVMLTISTGKLPATNPLFPNPTPTPFVQELQIDPASFESYTVNGKYTYLGLAVSYNLKFPKKGGDIEGSFSGVCNGTIDGNYTKQFNQMDGHLNGSCDTTLIKGNFNQPFFARINETDKTMAVEIRDKRILDLIGTLKIPFN